MKPICIVLTAMLLSAALVPVVQAMPNPASVFCEEQGGKIEIVRKRDGSELGLCYLPDGRILEEWTFFRMHQDGSAAGVGKQQK